MAYATVANFAQTVLEVEFTPNSGVYAKVCGLTSRDITRTSNMATSEIPDCDDESLPAAVEQEVQSQEVATTASGVWSAESHELLLDWWYSGQPLNIRMHHVKATTGTTEYESGPAFLTSIANKAARGTKVTADLNLVWSGIPVRTPKA